MLFIVEAKTEHGGESLAKHILVYPALSLAPRFPADMPIVLLYMKATQERDVVHFRIAECTQPDRRTHAIAIDQLTVTRQTHLGLPLL